MGCSVLVAVCFKELYIIKPRLLLSLCMNLEDIIIIIILYIPCRLCRAIALAAKAVKLSFTVTDRETQQQENRSSSLLSVVVDAQKDPTTGSIDGFLALTDSIIYAIKVANPKDSNLSQDDSQKLEAVSAKCMHFMNF